MRIHEVVWQPQFVDKLASKHNVTTREVEEVLTNRPNFRFVSKGNRSGENVYSAMGQTDEGRYLTVIFILKVHQRALIISARDMSKGERRSYGKRK